MKIYPSYDSLAIDLDLHFFDKISVLRNAGNAILIDDNRYWFVVTDDGHCHLFDKDGNLDDIRKISTLNESYIRSDDIKKIIIPGSVKNIGFMAFAYRSGMIDVTISDGVTSIDAGAFSECGRLTSVTISNSVASVGYYAFYGCKSLKSVFFKGKTLKQIKAMEYYPWRIKDENIIKAEFE